MLDFIPLRIPLLSGILAPSVPSRDLSCPLNGVLVIGGLLAVHLRPRMRRTVMMGVEFVSEACVFFRFMVHVDDLALRLCCKCVYGRCSDPACLEGEETVGLNVQFLKKRSVMWWHL